MLVVVKIKDLCKGVQRGPIGTTFNTPSCRSRLRSLITAIRMRNPFVSYETSIAASTVGIVTNAAHLPLPLSPFQLRLVRVLLEI